MRRRPDREPPLRPSLPAGATGPGCGASWEHGASREHGSSLQSGSQFQIWRSEGAVESNGDRALFRQEHSQLAVAKSDQENSPNATQLVPNKGALSSPVPLEGECQRGGFPVLFMVTSHKRVSNKQLQCGYGINVASRARWLGKQRWRHTGSAAEPALGWPFCAFPRSLPQPQVRQILITSSFSRGRR